ncbi:uncharacterized protein CIMG_05100 [Coccidioides immitis RS]|uniref:Uncharacterized protein n=3 Tax=Coccidioides immitis TaxID=5501 RepID=J3KEW1_COCIM|nr:uncharacterized protein CIMG_05100 [Coccidioides immitis RS]EAS34076.3 hypothetical protein CIMG_05100 [Coccidioides immitis RS]KMP05297.1 hypothetical protein CIRG_04978 [Coccidioides immitis RMSCC 2394]KMU85757.1 hypothetical protein CIHG_03797 [Coccidioides immitis H538.4]TPX21664.1 hypothetical protein DIZ76_015626 [Coccidioides immitis]
MSYRTRRIIHNLSQRRLTLIIPFYPPHKDPSPPPSRDTSPHPQGHRIGRHGDRLWQFPKVILETLNIHYNSRTNGDALNNQYNSSYLGSSTWYPSSSTGSFSPERFPMYPLTYADLLPDEGGEQQHQQQQQEGREDVDGTYSAPSSAGPAPAPEPARDTFEVLLCESQPFGRWRIRNGMTETHDSVEAANDAAMQMLACYHGDLLGQSSLNFVRREPGETWARCDLPAERVVWSIDPVDATLQFSGLGLFGETFLIWARRRWAGEVMEYWCG